MRCGTGKARRVRLFIMLIKYNKIDGYVSNGATNLLENP